MENQMIVDSVEKLEELIKRVRKAQEKFAEYSQEKVDAISDNLLKLQKQKQEYEAKQIMEAYQKSGKSLQELMTFLNV